ncbi:hypothetical protein TRICI_005029 [Trichomonascus ciferrii]|uniref:Actin-related protein 2/3 complex subunit 5 n=1 Tax=Trichomonascus ciferrii TaxID=44093 RepID=A0A642UWV5_9ASCO|nr:hypothetical protein TRICI_005029 [Trichomonascus ciferrii]
MSSVDFRRIDIDRLNPDNALTQEELVPPQAPVSAQDVAAKGQEARQLLSRGDYGGALKAVLDNPPYGGDEEAKTLNLKNFIEVVTAVKSSDITPIVEQLSPDNQNVLIKYLYKGMDSPLGQSHGNGGVLLSWFEKTVDITGQGSIIRYIADRRRV